MGDGMTTIPFGKEAPDAQKALLMKSMGVAVRFAMSLLRVSNSYALYKTETHQTDAQAE
jgi:hypothetical protein